MTGGERQGVFSVAGHRGESGGEQPVGVASGSPNSQFTSSSTRRACPLRMTVRSASNRLVRASRW